MEGIIITINKESLSDLIQSAVKAALTEFRKTASLQQEPHDDLLPAEDVSSPTLRPVKIELTNNDFVNFKIYKYEKEVYGNPDCGSNQETGKRHIC